MTVWSLPLTHRHIDSFFQPVLYCQFLYRDTYQVIRFPVQLSCRSEKRIIVLRHLFTVVTILVSGSHSAPLERCGRLPALVHYSALPLGHGCNTVHDALLMKFLCDRDSCSEDQRSIPAFLRCPLVTQWREASTLSLRPSNSSGIQHLLQLEGALG